MPLTRDLKVGVQLHCLAVKTGFDVYVYVGNSLISLYSRCEDLDSSYNVFDKISVRNAMTWTAMIASFAQHWEIEMCLEIYHRMRCSALKLNDYTLTSLFSACTGTGILGHGKNAHGQTIRIGLVKEGHVCLSLMFQHGVQPVMDHYSCIVYLLGRCGLLGEALEFIQKMPISPNAVIWGSLLSSSRLHENVCIGVHAADNLLLLEPDCTTTFLQLENLYASAGCWDKARL
ncbi:hypothetical protein GIB67_024953 [Kingdonia uniflora]|uniref:Pentatricopeptide repeat-containing protein n=1 Tax=Kingdonia uniflora TaxID=39325 RepID=A0A7J7NYQ4_9MAGN|nr:hypothetical protein GIB67_024953 [Kingdonia uniflora]